MHWPFRQVVFHVMSNARDRNVFPQLVGSFRQLIEEDGAECLKTCLLYDDVALVNYIELLCTDPKSTDGRYVAKSNRALQVLEMP